MVKQSYSSAFQFAIPFLLLASQKSIALVIIKEKFGLPKISCNFSFAQDWPDHVDFQHENKPLR